MKLNFVLGLLAAAAGVFASEEDDLAAKKAAYFGSAQQDTELTNFKLTYHIKEQPDLEPTEVAALWDGSHISLVYNFTNNEETDIRVVGLGGAFRDPLTGEYRVNLTSNSVGPVVVEPGQSIEVMQKIPLDFGAGSFYLAPRMFVVFNEELKVIQARGQLAVLKELPITFLNPQLLFVELLLLGLVGAAGYFLYTSYLQSYFKGTAPITKNDDSSAKSSGYDPSWLPSHYQVTQKKSKTRKAY